MKQEEKTVFAISQPDDEDVPIILIGVPTGAWEYMRDGKTHTFDLTSLGVPLKLVLFGATTHAAALKTLNDSLALQGKKLIDMRDADFSLKEKKQ